MYYGNKIVVVVIGFFSGMMGQKYVQERYVNNMFNDVLSAYSVRGVYCCFQFVVLLS